MQSASVQYELRQIQESETNSPGNNTPNRVGDSFEREAGVDYDPHGEWNSAVPHGSLGDHRTEVLRASVRPNRVQTHFSDHTMGESRLLGDGGRRSFVLPGSFWLESTRGKSNSVIGVADTVTVTQSEARVGCTGTCELRL